MNSIQFDCPHCQQSIEGPPELCGQVVPCPSCQASLQLPPAAAAAHGTGKPPVPRGHRQAAKAPAPAPQKFTFVEHLQMMWPVYSVIVWGTFLGGPHVRLGFDEASSSGTFVGGTLWPLLSFGIVGGVNAGILYTQLPDWAKFLLTAAVGVIYILLWSHIAPKPG